MVRRFIASGLLTSIYPLDHSADRVMANPSDTFHSLLADLHCLLLAHGLVDLCVQANNAAHSPPLPPNQLVPMSRSTLDGQYDHENETLVAAELPYPWYPPRGQSMVRDP